MLSCPPSNESDAGIITANTAKTRPGLAGAPVCRTDADYGQVA